MSEAREYEDKDCVKFVEDMVNAGQEVKHYRGRHFWEGPAVVGDSFGQLAALTSVVLQSDQLGLGVIVYPVASDEGMDPA